MKIAIPVGEINIETNISTSFARAPFFLIYDTESKETLFVDNTAATSRGGAGVKAAQIIADSNVDAILSPRLGQNAANAFKAADIGLYKTNAGSAKDNIDDFISGKLQELDEIHEGFHGGSN